MLFQLLLVAALCFLPVYEFSSPSFEITASEFCKRIGYIYYTGWYSTPAQKADNSEFLDCRSRFVSYLRKYTVPTDAEIDNFLNVCNIEKKISLKETSWVIDHFLKLDYNVVRIAELLHSFNNEQSSKLSVSFSKILLDYPTWKKLREIENTNINDCIFSFDSRTKIEALNSYADWWEKNDRSKDTYCNCHTILGLYGIFKDRMGSQISDITNLYDKVCAVDFPNKDMWNEDNLKCIAQSSTPINGNVLKQFLSAGVDLAKSYWCEKGSTSFPFDELREKINLSEDSSSPHEIQVMSAAISVDFTEHHRQKFVKIMEIYGGDFIEKKCQDDIIIAAFKRDFNRKVTDNNQIYTADKRYVWNLTTRRTKRYIPKYEEIEHPFNSHIEILMEIFLKTHQSSNILCEEFTKFLTKFKSILVQRNFSEESLTKDLTEFVKKKVDTDLMMQCYQFTFDFEKDVCVKHKMLPLPQNNPEQVDTSYIFYGYEEQFSEFRSELFKRKPPQLNLICKNQHPLYNINAIESIWELIKTIFNNMDCGSNLETLFDKVGTEVYNKKHGEYWQP